METETTLEDEDVKNEDLNDQVEDASDDHTLKESEETKNTEDKYKDAVRGLSKQGAQLSAYETELVDLARADSTVLQSIKDTSLQNKISRKLYGVSYEQAVELGKIDNEEIDDSRKDVLEIKHKLAKQEEQQRGAVERKFFKDKGIIPSEFNDDYAHVMDELSNLSPSYVERDYEGALEKAYMLAFPDNQAKKKQDAAKISEELSSPGGTGGSRPRAEEKPKLTQKDLDMLRGLGATKTMKKLGIK